MNAKQVKKLRKFFDLSQPRDYYKTNHSKKGNFRETIINVGERGFYLAAKERWKKRTGDPGLFWEQLIKDLAEVRNAKY